MFNGFRSFALVGLKVTGPDMERTASHYLEKQQVMDMAVLASHQFSQEDRKELNSLKDVVLEYGHLIDLNITKNQQALRLYSLPNKLSKPLLVEGIGQSKTQKLSYLPRLKKLSARRHDKGNTA